MCKVVSRWITIMFVRLGPNGSLQFVTPLYHIPYTIGSCFFLKSQSSFILTSALQLGTWKVGFSWPFTDKHTIELNTIFDNFPILFKKFQNPFQNASVAIKNSNLKNQCLKNGLNQLVSTLLISQFK